MSLIVDEPYYTTITNSLISIDKSDGIQAFFVHCTSDSSVSGTVSGIGTFRGNVGSGIAVTAGNSFEHITDQAFHGITITAPSGCTLSIGFSARYKILTE